MLSAAPADLPHAIERVQHDARDARRDLKALAAKAAKLEAAALSLRASPLQGISVLIEGIDGYDMAALKLLAVSFTKEPARLIVLFTTSAPVQVIAMRSPDVQAVDCGAIVAKLTGEFGGRGGGKPESAQAGGLAGASQSMVAAAQAHVMGALRADR
jgi:alanyl-tRNA synthetase